MTPGELLQPRLDIRCVPLVGGIQRISSLGQNDSLNALSSIDRSFVRSRLVFRAIAITRLYEWGGGWFVKVRTSENF